jgi:DNA-binding LacI/PurR family transcriptional regulator
MRRFRTSQRVVERCLAPHIAEGRIEVRRGLGIVVRELHETAAAWEADILLLYKVSDSRLAQNLISELERWTKAAGLSMLLLGFSDEAQALSILARFGRFKVCLLQAHFETLPLPFLSEISEKAESVVLDGISTTGLRMDAIGTNWREALEMAWRDLRAAGHDRIAFLTSGHSARQIAMARREYLRLSESAGFGDGWLIELDALPGSFSRQEMMDAIGRLRGASGKLEVTALITWGVVEGYMLDRALGENGLMPGRDLSVIMLGSVDFPSEHLNRFDTIGNADHEKIETFERILRARARGDGAPPEVHYLPIHRARYGSVSDLQG